MKSESDNFRASAIISVIDILKDHNVDIMIYEPTIKGKVFEEIRVENDLDTFKNESDVIIANRINEEIEDERPKIYTRDIFTRD